MKKHHERALNPRMGVLIRDKDTDEKPREHRGRDGRNVVTSPGTPGPQKLEEAGRTLPSSLRREHDPDSPGSQ